MGDSSGSKIRVHLADGDFLVRLGIERALEDLDYVVLESVSWSGEAAIAAAVAMQPDIVIMETALQGMDGIAAAAEIRAQAPGTKVVMLAAAADRETMMKAYSAGASSYLTKNGITEDLGPALRMVHRGATILSMPPGSPRLHRPVLDQQSRRREIGSDLSDREKKLLEGIVAGLTNAELGRGLHLSEATVKAHLSALMARLNVCNRVQLAVLGLRSGIGADQALI